MQKMIFVTREQVNLVNSYLNDGWIISSVHPIANFVTGNSYSHGDWGAYVVLEKLSEFNINNLSFEDKKYSERYNEFLKETQAIQCSQTIINNL